MFDESHQSEEFQSAIPKKNIGSARNMDTIRKHMQVEKNMKSKDLFDKLGEVGKLMKGEPRDSIEQYAEALSKVNAKVDFGSIAPKNQSIQEIFSSLGIEYNSTDNGKNIERAINALQERLVKTLPTPQTTEDNLLERQRLVAQCVYDLKVLKEQLETPRDIIINEIDSSPPGEVR